jgi:hypothetical protein
MAEWKKRALKTDDVIHFAYADASLVSQAPFVYVWDVDKTYLDTKFESLKGLWRTATEKADKKKNVPGSGELVRCLRDHWRETSHSERLPIFFITASPPQIEYKIHEKLRLDDVHPYGIFCKDNLQNLRPRKLWRITKHVGYKLQALMQLRAMLNNDVRMVLFGDDGESDAVIYSLFSDICMRRMNTDDLRGILSHYSVLNTQIDTILHLQDRVPQSDPVEKIYIHLAEDTDSDYYLKFGRRIVPTYDTFQMACDLYQDGRLLKEHVLRVAERLAGKFGRSIEQMDKSFDDLIRRERLGEAQALELIAALKTAKLISPDFLPSVPLKCIKERIGQTVTHLEGNFDSWIPEQINYLSEYR